MDKIDLIKIQCKVETLILLVPTGIIRNKLTEINIELMILIDKHGE